MAPVATRGTLKINSEDAAPGLQEMLADGIAMMGAHAINNGYLEVVITLVMGLMGFLFEKARIPLAPVALGLVLGPIAERNFMPSVIRTNWGFTQFFSRPISAVLIVLVAIFLLLSPMDSLVERWLTKRRARGATGSAG